MRAPTSRGNGCRTNVVLCQKLVRPNPDGERERSEFVGGKPSVGQQPGNLHRLPCRGIYLRPLGAQTPRRCDSGAAEIARIVSAILSLTLGLRTIKYTRTSSIVSRVCNSILALSRGPSKKNDGGTSSA